MSERSDRVLRQGLIAALFLLFAAGLLPPPRASAAGVSSVAGPAADKARTTLSGFITTRARVLVGGELSDRVTVLPKAVRTLTVQYRLAGSARFRNASSGKSTSTGLFGARMHPPASGIWEFRLRVTATPRAKAAVSPVRTVVASGKAAVTQLRGFVSSSASIVLGTQVINDVVVVPKSTRVLEVWSRSSGSKTFVLSSTGKSTRSGAYRAAFRPTTLGVWQFRLVVLASRMARAVTSRTRAITVTAPSAPVASTAPVPTTEASSTSTPAPPIASATSTPAPTETSTTPAASRPVARLRVNEYLSATVKVTVNHWVGFDAGDSSPSVGRTLVSGWLDFGDGSPSKPLPYYDEEEDYYSWWTSHTYTTPGAKTATLTVTDSGGLTASTAVTVLIYEEPTLTVTGTRATAGVPLTFGLGPWTPAGTSFTGYDVYFSDDSSYIWGDGPPPASLTHTFVTPGNYRVSIYAWNDAGGYVDVSAPFRVAGTTTTAILSVTDDGSPADKITVPTYLQFDASGSYADSEQTLVSASLDFGDETPAISFYGEPYYWKTSHRFVAAGTYKAILTIFDSTGGTHVDEVAINAFPPPTVTIRAASNPIQAGVAATFTVDAATPPGTTWTGYDVWGTGGADGLSGDGQPPSEIQLVFPTIGDYTVEIYLYNDAGGWVSDEVPITVQRPIAMDSAARQIRALRSGTPR